MAFLEFFQSIRVDGQLDICLSVLSFMTSGNVLAVYAADGRSMRRCSCSHKYTELGRPTAIRESHLTFRRMYLPRLKESMLVMHKICIMHVTP